VLRQYARTEPEWVRKFVKKYEEDLSPLSKREALKHISKAESESEASESESSENESSEDD
jgi:3-methyladenine DNA glycosylase AlkD